MSALNLKDKFNSKKILFLKKKEDQMNKVMSSKKL